MQNQKKQSNPQRVKTPLRLKEQKWPTGTIPLVSICCPTYNHSKFINDAIESFLNQKTTFPVEILIRDDASTDETVNIVKKYKDIYPSIIRPIFKKTNQFIRGKRATPEMIPIAKGEFIALCEGDDYWVDELKLHKQIEFLEQNQDMSGVFHRGYAVNEIKNRIPFVWDKVKYKQYYNQKDCIFHLLSGYPTASLVFRKICFPESKRIPKYYKKIPCDYTLDILIAERGNLGFMDFEGSAYRQHPGGIWSVLTHSQMHKQMVDRFSALLSCKELQKKYPELKHKVLHLMDVQWWFYFHNGIVNWFTSTIKIIWQQHRIGFYMIMLWIFRTQSPVRYKLRDILFKNN